MGILPVYNFEKYWANTVGYCKKFKLILIDKKNGLKKKNQIQSQCL